MYLEGALYYRHWIHFAQVGIRYVCPDGKGHGANMGPTWDLSAIRVNEPM